MTIGALLNIIWNGHQFHPDSLPDISSKVIIVTGGNNGVGKESVLQLAKHHPSKLYLSARSKAKYDIAMEDIKKAVPDARVDFLELDLASFASIKAAADQIKASNTRLDVLMNNAGVMALPPGLTQEGYEIQFGTNHVGHALFTKLLMPLLLETAAQPGSDVRIVNLSSGAEANAPKAGFLSEAVKTDMAEYHTYTRYGQSKLANILFSRELARRYPNLTVTAIHPGRVSTNLLTHFFDSPTVMSRVQSLYDYFVIMGVEKGAWNQLWAAAAPKEQIKSGTFYSPVGREEQGMAAAGRDEQVAKKLWDWQEAEFAKHGY